MRTPYSNGIQFTQSSSNFAPTPSSFTELTDTPQTLGDNQEVLMVNNGSLDWAPLTNSISTLQDVNDYDMTDIGKVLKVTNNGTEWAPETDTTYQVAGNGVAGLTENNFTSTLYTKLYDLDTSVFATTESLASYQITATDTFSSPNVSFTQSIPDHISMLLSEVATNAQFLETVATNNDLNATNDNLGLLEAEVASKMDEPTIPTILPLESYIKYDGSGTWVLDRPIPDYATGRAVGEVLTVTSVTGSSNAGVLGWSTPSSGGGGFQIPTVYLHFNCPHSKNWGSVTGDLSLDFVDDNTGGYYGFTSYSGTAPSSGTPLWYGGTSHTDHAVFCTPQTGKYVLECGYNFKAVHTGTFSGFSNFKIGLNFATYQNGAFTSYGSIGNGNSGTNGSLTTHDRQKSSDHTITGTLKWAGELPANTKVRIHLYVSSATAVSQFKDINFGSTYFSVHSLF
tara:strand:- start:165 stop:1523 length:1359 start_codon:yes stop_codon:yes gene_type:complete